MRTLIVLLLTVLFSPSVQAQCPSGLSGTYAVGPTGYFPSITRAMDTLKLKGVSGPVFLELQANYVSNVETFPIRLTAYPCADSTRAVTIRPAAGASNLQITSNHDTATIDINTGSYFIIDGRVGSTGTTRQLHIANTHLNGMAVRLINDATYNKVRYLDIRGVTHYAGRGVVTIDGSIRTRGNDYNRIDTCLIGDGATTPTCLIAFASNVIGNNNNLVDGCELFNFYDLNSASTGISVSTGNDSLAIIGNSIYQTAPRSYLGPIGSDVTCISVSGFIGATVIADNFIGGTAARAEGRKMEMTGFTSFHAIYISSRSGTPLRSIVQNNTIRNIRCVGNGSVELVNLGLSIGFRTESFNGYFQNNTIGNPDGDSSIYYRRYSGAADMNVIQMYPSGTDSILVNNNRIGGIYIDPIASSGDNISLHLLLVSPYGPVSPWRVTIKGNEFGNTIHPRSIWNHSGGTIHGIFVMALNCSCSSPLTPNTLRIEDNLLSNFYSDVPSQWSTVGAIYGIYTDGQSGGYVSIANNRVNRMIMNNSTAYVPAVAGIYCNFNIGTNSLFDIKNNTIHTLYSLNNEAGASHDVTGIRLQTLVPNMTVNVSRNFIHSLKAGGGQITNRTIGIDNDPGYPGSIDNNMIRLGLDSSGQSITAPGPVFGILEHRGNTSIIHNTIFIGGENVTPFDDQEFSTISSAYYRMIPFDDNTSNIVRNNIFVNLRKNVPPANPHPKRNYVIRVYGLTATSAVRVNNNLYQSADTSTIAEDGFITLGLSQWRVNTGQDAQSIQAVPNLVNAGGTSATVDLHLKMPSPADGAGTAAFTTATDIDGDDRSALTPVDIGADGGLYSLVTAVGQLQLQGYALAAFPNPASKNLFVKITAPLTTKAQLQVYNLAGQSVATRELSLLRGDNNFRLQELEKMARGTYIIELQTAKGKLQVTIVKQ